MSYSQAVVAVNDTVNGVEDSTITILVQQNDYGGPIACGGDYSTNLWTSPRHGTASVVGGKSILYIPAANYFGNDTFQYQLCDCIVGSNNCSIATVIVRVVNRNDPPTANFDLDTVYEDNTLIINVQNNDTEPDGDFLVTVNGGQAPAHGIAIILNNDSIKYIPNANYFGPDSFIYKVCDNPIGSLALCDTAWVYIYVIPVNDKPLAVDDTKQTNEDTPINIDAQVNDSDVDGDVLTTTIITVPKYGTATVLNGDSILYTPAANYYGKDTLYYKICDNGTPSLCDTAVIILTINAINDKPIAVDDLNNTTNEDSPIVIKVKSNDNDVDANPLITSIISNPTNGTVIVLNGDSVRYTPAANYYGQDTFYYKICDNGAPILCDTAMVVVTILPINDKPIANDDFVSVAEEGTIVIYPLANDTDVENGTLTISIVSPPKNGIGTLVGDSITYTPNQNFNGNDTIVLQICDNGIPQVCDTSLIVFYVTPVNDRPVAVDDYVTTAEAIPTKIDVQGNDFDVDNTVFTTQLFTFPKHGAATVINQDSILYIGNTGYFGQDTFSYIICDNAVPALCDTAVVYITIGQVNDPPIAINDILQIIENSPAVAINVQANDHDVDNVNLTTTIIKQPLNGTASVSNGDSIIYQPAVHFSGNDTIIYMICDDGVPVLCDTAIVIITVNNINDKPIAVDDLFNFMNEDDSLIIHVKANDIDYDNNVLTVTIISQPQHGIATVLNGDSVRYTPNPDYNGNDTFIYRICDNGLPPLCDTAIVVMAISPINDVPVANNDTATVNSGNTVIIPILANDYDVDGETLSNPSVLLPNHGSIAINADGSIAYTPDPNYEGYDTIKYYICDGLGNCDSAYVIIYVNKNEKPIAVSDNETYFETQAMEIAILSNDSDPDGDSLTVSIIQSPAHGTVSYSNGVATYLPTNGYTGVDSFMYTICDNGSPIMCDSAWVVVNILEGDIKPIIDNSISPNGDGQNDALIIHNLSLFTNTTMKIINRWGDVVFNEANYQNDFDGNEKKSWKNFGDDKLPEGTYFYIFNYTYNSQNKTMSGYVVLKR